MENNDLFLIFYLFYSCGWLILAFKIDMVTMIGLIFVIGGGFVWFFLWLKQKGYIKNMKGGK